MGPLIIWVLISVLCIKYDENTGIKERKFWGKRTKIENGEGLANNIMTV
jgi:hypothetical protein